MNSEALCIYFLLKCIKETQKQQEAGNDLKHM